MKRLCLILTCSIFAFLANACRREDPAPAPEEEKPNPAKKEKEKSKPVRKPLSAEFLAEAQRAAEKYLLAVQPGPDNASVQGLETESYRNRPRKDSDLVYSFAKASVQSHESDAAARKATFHGQCNVLANLAYSKGVISTSTPSGGSASFGITLKPSESGAWLVDDFRFSPRPPQAGPAELAEKEKLLEIRNTFSFPNAVWQKFKIEDLVRKLDTKAWVMFFTGGPVEFRLKIEEPGRDADDAFTATCTESEGRLCLLLSRDLRNDGSWRPTETVVTLLGPFHKMNSDLPAFWFHWKGAVFKEKAFNVQWKGKEAARVLEIEATETGVAKDAKPRKVLLTLYAKRVANKK
jgi:hypothetical protein